ncbi:MAG TPA: phage holin family protein [Gemmatimonadaceae bacterium]|nr:phage holin family protein [Gemmatimonadaceae bacterium]
MTARTVRADPDAGIPDLVRSLGEDSRRLVDDEIRLAKLEAREAMHRTARGSMWLGIAFGVGVIALTAFTIFLAAIIGRALGSYWAGALITGALHLGLAFVLIRSGTSLLAEPSYTLEQTRDEVKETARWVSEVRAERAERSDGRHVAAR